ncbi:MAG: hypothetical protein R8L07_21935 [Alphaproteobacteria bacterium]|nr:hypothetical protein [Alphaproteobacteria bacterium]
MFIQTIVSAATARATPRLIPSSDLLPTHQEHYWLSEYLSGLPGDGDMPDWQDIRPENFHHSVFPSLVLFDVVESEDGTAADFVYRVMGEKLIEFSRVNMTGKPLSKFPFLNIRRSVTALARRAHESYRPVFSSTKARFDYERSLLTERSFYPIRRNGRICILALITVTKPPIPFATLFSTSTRPPSEIESFRVLEAPHAWV